MFTSVQFEESLTAIVDCFRGVLTGCGNDRVKFTIGGQLKRRKSRTPALDVPSGMHRNLSESQLVQAGSKAVINFAEQFSKLGHSLNPKILTGKKPTATTATTPPTEELVNQYSITVKAESHKICNVCRENAANDVAESSNKYNDNSFMKGVGIVMVDAAEMAETQSQSEPRKAGNSKNQENVGHISISSVTDNVKLPPDMLDMSEIPGKSSNPQISVQETEDRGGERNPSMKMCHSVADMRSSDSAFGEDGARYEISINHDKLETS